MILLLDTEFCLSDFLPLVNFKYCHGFYESLLGENDFIVEASQLIRTIPKLGFSLQGANLSEIIDLEEKVLTLTNNLISLDNIKFIEMNPSVWYRVKLKLRLLAFHLALTSCIKVLIDDFKLTSVEDLKLDDIQKEMEIKTKLNFLYILKFRQDINSHVRSLQFMMFLRQELWHCIGLSTIDFVQSLFHQLMSTNVKLNLAQTHEDVIDVPICDVENALYNGNSLTNLETLIMPSYIINQLDVVYQGSFKSTTENLNLNYNCFIMAKMCSVFIILLKVCDNLNNNDNFSTEHFETAVRKIVTMAKRKLSSGDNFNNGTELSTAIDQVENWNPTPSTEVEAFTINSDDPTTDLKFDYQMEEILNSVIEDSNLNAIWSDLDVLMNDPLNYFDCSIADAL